VNDMPRKDDAQLLKEELDNKAKQLESEIKSELVELKKNTQKTLKKTLLIAGGTVAILSLFKLIASDKKKEDGRKKSETKYKKKSGVSSRLRSIALALALELAKKKIIDVINKNQYDPGKPSKK